MTYQTIMNRDSPNRTPAADVPRRFGQARKVKSITIHWWGDPASKPTFDGVVDYLCRTNGTSSAHYVVEAGRVACIVDPDDAAWHAGSREGNATSIGIECNPRASDGDYATVAELVAALRKVYGPIPLVRHSSWKATACPGVWDLDRINELAGAAPAKPAPSKPAPAPKPKPSQPASRALRRGSSGDRVRRLQAKLRRDYPLYAKHLATDGHYGPDTEAKVREFQRRAGLTVDGVAGPATHAALGLPY